MKPKLYLINGPLGAGKTTLLRELLKLPEFQDARVIENEFASTSIDTQQLHDHQAEVKTIAGVCICCSTGDELIEALQSLAGSTEPVIIEATGVANSLMLLEKLIIGDILDRYELAHGIFVLDAVEAMNDTRSILKTYADEIAAADTLLISKSDLVEPEDFTILQELIDTLRSGVTIPVYEGVCDTELFNEPTQMLAFYESHNGVIHAHDGDMNYVTLHPASSISPDAIERNWPQVATTYGLRRMKGDFVDPDGVWWHVEATPAQCRVMPTDAEIAQIVCIGEQATKLTSALFEAEVGRG